MPETRTYYVICEDNCKFESMTKEQIIAAIAEATSATPTHIDDAFITKVKESNANVALTFWKGTQAEFNALGVSAPIYKVGIGSNGKLYFTPMIASDVIAHASKHAKGESDEITPSDIGALPDTGGTMGGNIAMDGHGVTGLVYPTSAADAATKQYVDIVDEKEITFHCGDGSGSTTVRAVNYAWLDTGNTLNIPLDDYALEVDFLGYGRVGSQNSHVAVLYLFYEKDGVAGVIDTIKCVNPQEFTDDTYFKFTNTEYKGFFGNNMQMSKRAIGVGESSETVAVVSTDFSGAVLKKIQVKAGNASCNLQNCFIKFTKLNSHANSPVTVPVIGQNTSTSELNIS